MKLGVQWLTLVALVFTWFLIALAFIDLEYFLLPDKLTIPLIFLGLITSALGGFTDLTSSIFGTIAGYLSLWTVYQTYRLLTGREGFGFGDFKMLAAIGGFIGWQLLPAAVLLSAGTGAIVGTIMILLQRHQRGQLVPFGPYLAGGGWLTLLWGQQLNEWFYSIITL
jgi:leader peptidase (prepilin peptidase)/N-methyltransferase